MNQVAIDNYTRALLYVKAKVDEQSYKAGKLYLFLICEGFTDEEANWHFLDESVQKLVFKYMNYKARK